jgi:hypothetical protein
VKHSDDISSQPVDPAASNSASQSASTVDEHGVKENTGEELFVLSSQDIVEELSR